MVSPPARDVAQFAARRASAIFRAVVRGPKPPAPAGWGVERTKFQGALPWFRWRELVVFANHFAQHGSVANDLAVDLAAEVGNRLDPGTMATSTYTKKSPAMEAVALPGSTQEVAAVVYSFSKLSPQMAGYSPVYSSVAKGIDHYSWTFSRLEAGLIGTAFVDVQVHLDSLPALLRPVLQKLHQEDSHGPTEAVAASISPDASLKSGADVVTIDELRYLVHACTCLPSPGIRVEEVEVLSALTQRLITDANFAKTAHLVASWLRIRAPAKAKQHYLDALGAVCAKIMTSGRPTLAAHPLLISDLGSSLGTLLAREGHRDPPPITPPLVRDITSSLIQITRGLLSQVDTRPPKGDALNFADWVEIARVITDFCEEHGGLIEKDDSGQTLPGWAAEALGFVVVRAHRPLAAKTPPDLTSLLTMLRLLRRYRANPAPDGSFFIWMAKQLTVHHQATTDSVVLAEIVGELVPRLPQKERARFARELFSKMQEEPAASKVQGSSASMDSDASPAVRLLHGDERSTVAGVALATPLSVSSTRKSPRKSAVKAKVTNVNANASAAPNLWNRLGSASEAHEQQQARLHLTADTAKQSLGESHSAVEKPQFVLSSSAAHAEKSDSGQVQEVSSRQTEAANAELRAQLESALKLVKVLEEKLENNSVRLRDEVEKLRSRVVAVEVKAEDAASSKSSLPVTEAAVVPPFPSMQELPALPQMLDFQNLFPEARPTRRMQGVTKPRHTLHVRKPFNFDDVRRAETDRLQQKRIRVLVPSDPMQPFGWKW